MDCHHDADVGGFSTFELVIALAILSVLAAITLPSLDKLAEQMTFALQRQDVERQLNHLPQTALRRGQSLLLVSSEDNPSNAAGTAELDPYPIHLPEGWAIIVDAPIHYRFSGSCDGGRLQIRAPSNAIRYVLAGPFCQLRPE